MRENIHKALNLPLNRPYFRRIDRFDFLKVNNSSDESSNYLVNPHLNVKASGGKRYNIIKTSFKINLKLYSTFFSSKW